MQSMQIETNMVHKLNHKVNLEGKVVAFEKTFSMLYHTHQLNFFGPFYQIF
jgi:hypothetical protein